MYFIYRNRFKIFFTLFLICAINIKAGELKKIIPLESELGNFKITEEPQYYDQGNLWEYINGAAPGYLAYGFEKLVTFSVLHQLNEAEISVDVYDMADSLNAFGIYSIEKSVEGSSEDFGSGSFISDYALFFWQDRFYVKLMAFDLTPETAKSLSLVAKIITKKIPQKGKLPFLFSIFPEPGQIKRSNRYTRRDVLGQEYFSHGYSIDYNVNEHKYQIFLIRGNDKKQTKTNFKKYLNYQKSIGNIKNEKLLIGEQSFVGKDSYYGNLLFAHWGINIIGVLGFKDLHGAKKIISGMFSRLNKKQNE